MPKIKKNPGNLFYTYGNYTGPGNRTDPDYLRKYRPVDRLDRAAKFHDLAYKQLQKEGRNPYFRFSKADQLFLDRVSGISGIPARVASGAFQVKKALNKALGFSTMKRQGSKSRSRTRSRGRSTPSKLRTAPSRSKLSAGHYGGKLRPIRPASKPGKYDKFGFRTEHERYGSQTLNEVCYLGATSYVKSELGNVIGVAFMRMIMKKHYGIEYSHPDQHVIPTLPGATPVHYAGPQSINFFARRNEFTGSADTINMSYNMILNPASGLLPLTLKQAGAVFNSEVLSGVAFGGSANSTGGILQSYNLYGYQFIDLDYTVAAADPGGVPVNRLSPVFTLDNQYFKCYSVVKMSIQNVTPADDGSLVTTKVDVNPIKGKLVTFKEIMPYVRVPSVQAIGTGFGAATADNAQALCIDPNGDGIIKPAAPGLTGAWQQIPPSSMFVNAKKELSISLNPGGIKDFTIMFKFNGTLQNFQKGTIQFNNGLDAQFPYGGHLQHQFGTSFLFMLEKRMPTGGLPVSVNFHYESQLGAVFGRRKGVVMQRGAGASTPVTVA